MARLALSPPNSSRLYIFNPTNFTRLRFGYLFSSGESSNSVVFTRPRLNSPQVWVPVLLGGVLLVSVVGWCSVNVYRASQDNLEETVDVHKVKYVS